MTVDLLYRHPGEQEAVALLTRKQPYPATFTLSERTSERLNRVRHGLTHVMTDLLPVLDKEQYEELYCWLDKILVIIDATLLDAEGQA
ncbi:nicotinic acetylcholine receptor subunit beta [Mangrovibacter yixingensis]|uniref:nicotinic acetylcholine receptor subunit beta n=1 Tax=Mangrovibacter yixingensis TaxID=1529639 RepID=UPI001CFB4B76|nr:nicotinic acetylcholine receptor subunit beta [Mangrovibacter yixingensis]